MHNGGYEQRGQHKALRAKPQNPHPQVLRYMVYLYSSSGEPRYPTSMLGLRKVNLARLLILTIATCIFGNSSALEIFK